MANFGIIAPYFVEDVRQTVTVTSARYEVMLREFLTTELRRRGIDLNTAVSYTHLLLFYSHTL